MATIPGLDADVFFGTPETPLPDWKDIGPDDGDDDPVADRESVSGLLGFDLSEAYPDDDDLGDYPDGDDDDEEELKLDHPTVKPSPFLSKSWLRKNRGQPCKQGEAAALTGCIPNKEEPGQQPDSQGQQQQNPQQFTTETASAVVDKLAGDQSQEQPVQADTESGHVTLERVDHAQVPEYLVIESKEYLKSLPRPIRRTIIDYTVDDYHVINKDMRQCPPDFECVEDDTKIKIEELTKVIDGAPHLTDSVEVYRGLNFDQKDKLDAFLGEMTKLKDSGRAWQMPSFTSTSFDPEIASQFTNDRRRDSHPLMIRIKAKSGLYVEPISDNGGELELIQSPKASYKVTGVGKASLKNNTLILIELEEVTQ